MADQKTGSGGNKPNSEHNVAIRGAVTTHTPVDEQKQHRTEREEDTTTHSTERTQDRRREVQKMGLEGLALLAVLFYSGVTSWQACLLRKSITDNGKQFQTDQRPYVWDSNVFDPANVKIVAGQRMWINISLINFGKAPALNARGLTKIFVGGNAAHDADEWFASIGDKALPVDPNDAGIVVPPGIPSGEITAKSAFGGGGYFTAMSDNVLTQDDVDYILHSNEKIAIVAHIQYFDAYGTRYWSDLCLSRFDTGVYPNCKKHNEMH